MSPSRLSTVDASFLTVETATQHMHVGWLATLSPPREGPAPSFEDLRDHIGTRLRRAPRWQQKLAEVPFGLDDPVWVDDLEFDLERHIELADGEDVRRVVDSAMSFPLDRDRPLWKMWIAPELPDGRIGLVGKAHHCMVDGVAMLELANVLFDETGDAHGAPPDPPTRHPGASELVAGAFRNAVRKQVDIAKYPWELARHPERLVDVGRSAEQTGRALVRFARRAPASLLNVPTSPRRHLASCTQPLAELRQVKRRWGTSLNDVVLAAAAGGIRRFLERLGEDPARLKAMVPVNVRDEHADAANIGNHISFMWIDLPCDEPDPVRRLLTINAETAAAKREGLPQGTDAALKVLSYFPRPVQQAIAPAFGSPWVSNVVISNIPGPPVAVHVAGCEVDEVFPIVPLSDSHAVSIGVMTVKGCACFGIYADRESLPQADQLAHDIAASVQELLAVST